MKFQHYYRLLSGLLNKSNYFLNKDLIKFSKNEAKFDESQIRDPVGLWRSDPEGMG